MGYSADKSPLIGHLAGPTRRLEPLGAQRQEKGGPNHLTREGLHATTPPATSPRRRVCRDRGPARPCGLGATRGAQTGGVRPPSGPPYAVRTVADQTHVQPNTGHLAQRPSDGSTDPVGLVHRTGRRRDGASSSLSGRDRRASPQPIHLPLTIERPRGWDAATRDLEVLTPPRKGGVVVSDYHPSDGPHTFQFG